MDIQTSAPGSNLNQSRWIGPDTSAVNHLANERTFLSWVTATCALLSLAMNYLRLDAKAQLIPLMCMGVSIAMIVWGFYRYHLTCTYLQQKKFEQSIYGYGFLSLIIITIVIIMIVTQIKS